MEELDFSSYLPDLPGLLAEISQFLRILVMVGPLAILGLGLYYFLAAPKEANHSVGYRFRYGMAKARSWQFMQRVAGIGFSLLGLTLTIIMAIQCAQIKSLAPMQMALAAGKLILWQIAAVIGAIILIDFLVIIVFDSEGNRRSDFRGMKL
ncbi:MAG: SdpI family protein [Oscillospiraceae bacterium]|nr:SdpI family protein [Oscillospiraceae bacterium]